MPDEAEAFRQCFEGLIKEFGNYDKTVDVVACWQSILSHGYADQLTYFDRFPEDPSSGLTPDFTALFGDYGIVFEIKRTFPQEEKAFENEVKQLLRYDDGSFTFRTGPGTQRAAPKTKDIVLILHSPSASFEIAARIEKLLADGKVKFQNSLIILETIYESADAISRYLFRKIPSQNRPFRDHALPPEKRFETILETNHKTLHSYPKHFVPWKAKYVFCNDEPPPLYMAVFLWTKVFYDLLGEGERENWRRGSPSKSFPIRIGASALTTKVQNLLGDALIRRGWINKALDFMVASGLGSKVDAETYEVHYRNLTQMVGQRKFAGTDEPHAQEVKEYGALLADYHCKAILEHGKQAPTPVDSKAKQAKLPLNGV